MRLRDGRRLAYTEWGNAGGTPVLYFHGFPGSRLWCPDEQATLDADVRLILPERPGLGRSDPKVPRTLGEWPADVLELADALGLSTFAVIGVSAGGPYAAACAALIPSRLTEVALVSSGPLSEYNWEARPGIESSWSDVDRGEFELIQRDFAAGVRLATANLIEFAREIEEQPEIIDGELAQAEGDRWFFTDPNRVESFHAYLRETFRQGPDAAVWEFIKVYQPWGFRLSDISIPVTVWHGAQDPWVTDDFIDYQVATIPRCSLVVWQDSGHLGFVKHWAEILETLTGGDRPAGVP